AATPALPAPRPGPAPAAAPTPRRALPPVGEDALLWKELHAEPHLAGPQWHPQLGLFLLIVCGSVAFGLIYLSIGYGESGAGTARWANLWVRGTGTSLTGLLLVLVAFYAAGSVSRERERQTLDSLRAVPEESREVLLAKWLGGFLSARKAWWC